jgi:hypothetical protein
MLADFAVLIASNAISGSSVAQVTIANFSLMWIRRIEILRSTKPKRHIQAYATDFCNSAESSAAAATSPWRA